MTITASSPILLFTDLDGTLLDHHSYTWAAAEPALRLAHDCRVPVIFTTSKTLTECLVLQQAMGVTAPLIFENGAGAALPESQFRGPSGLEKWGDCWLQAFTVRYTEVRRVLEELRHTEQYRFRGFGDMTSAEIARLTGLTPAAADRARQRRHGEPLIWDDTEARQESFRRQLSQRGLNVTRGGRFLHVLGRSDKGAAMAWVARQYPEPRPLTVALGDSENDRSLLEKADIAVVVRSPVQSPPAVAREPSKRECIVTNDPGPVGWNHAVQQIIREFVDG